MYNNQQEYFDAIHQHKPRQKPVVHFKPLMCPVVVGYAATVKVLDHPASYLNDAEFVHTSEVVSYDEATGGFETRNTKYVLAV